MRSSSKWFSARLAMVPLLGLGLGCGSSEVDRAELPAVPAAKPVPVEQAPEIERPEDIGGSSAGMTQDPTRGLTQ